MIELSESERRALEKLKRRLEAALFEFEEASGLRHEFQQRMCDGLRSSVAACDMILEHRRPE